MNTRAVALLAIGLVSIGCRPLAASDTRVEIGALPMGASFPEFTETDINGKSLSLADYKGKIVLIDFWATWCGPCVAELPNVLKTYESTTQWALKSSASAWMKTREALTGFTKARNLPWQQYFDGQGWKDKLSQRFGIRSIPATYLVGKDGKLIGKNFRGEALEQAVAKALGER